MKSLHVSRPSHGVACSCFSAHARIRLELLGRERSVLNLAVESRWNSCPSLLFLYNTRGLRRCGSIFISVVTFGTSSSSSRRAPMFRQCLRFGMGPGLPSAYCKGNTVFSSYQLSGLCICEAWHVPSTDPQLRNVVLTHLLILTVCTNATS